MSNTIKINAETVYSAIIEHRSFRSIIRAAVSKAFDDGKKSKASARTAIVGGINKVLADYAVEAAKVMADLNASLAKLGDKPDPDKVSILKGAAANAVTDINKRKNKDLDMVRIYSRELLTEWQQDGRAKGMRATLSVLKTGKANFELVKAEKKKSQAGSNKGRKSDPSNVTSNTRRTNAQKAKGKDAESQSWLPLAAIRDVFDHWLEDPTDAKNQTAFAKAMTTYTKEWKKQQAALAKQKAA